jgi:hypothetical protein
LDDPAAVKDRDAIGTPQGREAMRDHAHRGVSAQPIADGLDRPLALVVKGARRLIEDQQRRVAQQGARENEPLTLAAGEPAAALPYDGLESRRSRWPGRGAVAPR